MCRVVIQQPLRNISTNANPTLISYSVNLLTPLNLLQGRCCNDLVLNHKIRKRTWSLDSPERESQRLKPVHFEQMSYSTKHTFTDFFFPLLFQTKHPALEQPHARFLLYNVKLSLEQKANKVKLTNLRCIDKFDIKTTEDMLRLGFSLSLSAY